MTANELYDTFFGGGKVPTVDQIALLFAAMTPDVQTAVWHVLQRYRLPAPPTRTPVTRERLVTIRRYLAEKRTKRAIVRFEEGRVDALWTAPDREAGEACAFFSKQPEWEWGHAQGFHVLGTAEDAEKVSEALRRIGYAIGPTPLYPCASCSSSHIPDMHGCLAIANALEDLTDALWTERGYAP